MPVVTWRLQFVYHIEEIVTLIPIPDLQLVNNTVSLKRIINQDLSCSLNENIDCNALIYLLRLFIQLLYTQVQLL